jgi:hypothetical protein
MKPRLATSHSVVVVLVLFALVVSSGALAKNPPVFPPKKNGVYVGTIKSVFDLAVTLKVSSSGKSARIVWACGTGRGKTTVPNVPIDSAGKFTASGNLWKVGGRFVSATEARVTLSDIGCGGSKGTTKLTLK